MIIKRILYRYHLLIARRNLKKNAILDGSTFEIGPSSNVQLLDGAKRTNVILKDGCWPLGSIAVQDKGVVVMHEHSKIAPSTQIKCVNRVEIGPYSMVAENTVICDNNNHPVSPSYRKKMRLTPAGDQMRMWKYSANAPIIIGENCWIGSNVRICKGVSIGNNSVVAACSVVTKDVPANCIVAGNPAKVVKTDIDQLPEPVFP